MGGKILSLDSGSSEKNENHGWMTVIREKKRRKPGTALDDEGGQYQLPTSPRREEKRSGRGSLIQKASRA